QIVAAVVSPSTNPWECRTAPAPRNPIPEMICAAILVGSPPSSWATLVEILMNNVEPTQIRILVRRPAGLSRISRSTPMMPPSSAASSSLIGMEGSIFKISDCGLRIADCGLRGPSLAKGFPKSEIRNPKSAIASQFLKMRERLELTKTLVNFGSSEIREPVQAELLHVKRRHDRTKDDAAPEYSLVHIT